MRKNKEQWKPTEVYYDAASYTYFTKDGRRSSGDFEIGGRKPQPGDDYIPELCISSSPTVVNTESMPIAESCLTFSISELQRGIPTVTELLPDDDVPYFGRCKNCGGTLVRDKYVIRCPYCETRYEK